MMTRKSTSEDEHRHKEAITHLLRQRAGIPYEVEQKVCTSCHRVLDEKPLKRAAA